MSQFFVNEGNLDTVIEKDVNFSGNIQSQKSLMIKGRLIGNLTINNTLYIDHSAFFRGKIQAQSLSLMGRVEGDVFLEKDALLYESAQLFGDLTADEIEIRRGAIFDGRCIMKPYSERLQDSAEAALLLDEDSPS